nr:MAG TPA: hypothetical protein [Caudoviricetes sp.]
MSLQVEINWGDSANTETNSIEYVSSDEVNSISNKKIGVLNEYKNSFLIGTSKFSEDCVYNDYFGGLISKTSSDENGNIDFTLTLNCVNVSSLTFKFDEKLGIYPTRMLINNVEYQNSNAVFTAVFTKKITGNVVINFTKLSVSNKPLIITFITSTLTRRYDYSAIKNLTLGSNISNENSISFGVTGKYGSFILKDKNHEINAILKNTKKYNFECRVYYNDDLLGTFKITNVESSESKYEYNITLSDFTDDFNNSYVNAFFMEEENSNVLFTPIVFLNTICENSTSTILKAKNINYQTYDLRERLTNTRMPLMFNNEKKSVMSVLNSWCEMTQTNIVINAEGSGLEVIDFG